MSYTWDDIEYNYTIGRLLKDNRKYVTLETKRLPFHELVSLVTRLRTDGHRVDYYSVGCDTSVELNVEKYNEIRDQELITKLRYDGIEHVDISKQGE